MDSGDERSRMITFDGGGFTIMVGVHRNKNGTIRLDGWLSPAGCHPVELSTEASSMTTHSDVNGRFAIDHIPPGRGRLVVRPVGWDYTISTPAIALLLPEGS
jgi:hypothetical protein